MTVRLRCNKSVGLVILLTGLSGGCDGGGDATPPGAGGAFDAGASSGFGAGGAGPGGGASGGGTGARTDGSVPGSGGDACGTLTATIRDFRASHIDFQNKNGGEQGIVAAMLGPDRKPVYAGGAGTNTTHGAAAFDQWYRDVPGVNMPFSVRLALSEQPVGSGNFVYDSDAFFPLDGMGWPGEERHGHNFHFTTEIHATFRYGGGEVFTFRGDDDVFVFVNGRLAIDLGGVHGAQSQTLDFDAEAAALGIQVGQTYPLDLFHAERHTVESNFRIETSIACFVLI